MAEDNFGALAKVQQGLANVPTYGATDEQYQSLKNAQEQALTALQQRYQDPNWFNVAAAFAKPQLGGFAASLGSAFGELGKNVDLQREQQLPIASMRSQLAQTNLLLSQNKAVSDMLAKRKADGLPITPDFVSEIVARAPESPVAKALSAQINTQQKGQEITSSLQANALKAMDFYRNQGQEIPNQLYTQAGLPPPGKVEKPNGDFYPLGAIAPSETQGGQKNTVYVLPNGARANEDVYKLHKEGVPIISNMRTQEEQDALRDPNNPKFTKQGLPVSDNSKHLTGNAIDVDPSKITEDQKQLLKDQGWTQPIPDKDPGHWERATKSANAPTGPYPMTLTPPDVMGKPDDIRREALAHFYSQAEAIEKPQTDRFGTMQMLGSGTNYTQHKQEFDEAQSMLQNNKAMAAKVFNIVQQNGPLAAALQQGIGANIGTFGANINLPVKAALDAGLNTQELAFLNRISSLLVTLGNVKLRSQGTTTSNSTQAEYMHNLEAAAGMNQPPQAALNMLNHDAASFDHNYEWYNQITQELKQNKHNKNSATPLTDIVNNSPVLKPGGFLDKKYSSIHSGYSKQYQDYLASQK